MKSKSLLLDLILFILILTFFYEGLYRLLTVRFYHGWLLTLPLPKAMTSFLAYSIPISELALSIAFMTPASRSHALIIATIAPLTFILYLIYILLCTHYLVWPYHAFWAKAPTWGQIMLYMLSLSWLAFSMTIISARHKRFAQNQSAKSALVDNGEPVSAKQKVRGS